MDKSVYVDESTPRAKFFVAIHPDDSIKYKDFYLDLDYTSWVKYKVGEHRVINTENVYALSYMDQDHANAPVTYLCGFILCIILIIFLIGGIQYEEEKKIMNGINLI